MRFVLLDKEMRSLIGPTKERELLCAAHNVYIQEMLLGIRNVGEGGS